MVIYYLRNQNQHLRTHDVSVMTESILLIVAFLH
jgi:hypothetical protein